MEKVSCEPYEITNKETGEVLSLNYRWVYLKLGDTVEDAVEQETPQVEPELV